MQDTDLTTGNVWRHIFNIAIPAIFGHVFNMLYNWVDSYWGGKLGVEALSAFGITFPIFLFAIALGQCLGTGGMVLISNALGAQKTHEAKHYMKQTVLLSGVIGVLLYLCIILFSESLIIFLGARGKTLALSTAYIHTLALGMPFLLVFFALNTSLVSQGNTKFMRNILIMNFFINLGLDPLLMYGLSVRDISIIPSLGIKGVALATVIVQVLGAVLAWIKIQGMESTQWEKGESNRLEISSATQVIKYGLPTFLQITMSSLGIGITNYFLSRIGVEDTQYLLSSFHTGGEHAVAGYGLGLRIEQLILVPSIGIRMSLSALAGQNNGAKKYARIRESYIKAMLVCIGLWLVGMLPVTLIGDRIARIFTDDARVVQVTFFYLFYAFAAFMGYQLMGNASHVMSAMKHPWIVMIVLFVRQTVLKLIFIPLLAYKLGKGIYGVFGSAVIGVWICAVVLVVLVMVTLHKKIKAQEQVPTQEKIG